MKMGQQEFPLAHSLIHLMTLVVVMMFCLHFLKCFQADRLLNLAHLAFGESEDLVCLDAVVAVLNKLAVLHHTLYVIVNPGLLCVQLPHVHIAHVAEKLRLCEVADLVLLDLDVVLFNQLVYDKGPFQ